MSMTTWVEHEVALACEHENPNRQTDEFDYGCACYESALRAFKSLMDDGHSGFSLGMTKTILNRLIEGKPLTPIEDTDDVWMDVSSISSTRNESKYQCSRMSSLFKTVSSDGVVKYTDNNHSYCIDVNSGTTYHNGFISSVISEMFPISMPYYPVSAIKVYCEDFLFDTNNGDFDTIGILYIVKPDGERLDINQYYKESGDTFAPIDEVEYTARKDVSMHKSDKPV